MMKRTTEHGNYRYGYDKAYRLSSASTAGSWTYNNSDQLLTTPTDSYEYTANGNTKKITPADTTQKASEYLYDARDRLVEVKKDNATLQSNGDFIQGYGYKPNTSYTTNPQYTLTPKTSGIGYDFDFYHNDHLATPQKLTNNTGAVSWAMESSAFGETTIKTQTTKNNLRFPGQYYDVDIKLAQNYFRDYAPSLGRYVETDPIGLIGGVNFYIYSLSAPIVNFDTQGLSSDPVTKGSEKLLKILKRFNQLNNFKKCMCKTNDAYSCCKSLGIPRYPPTSLLTLCEAVAIGTESGYDIPNFDCDEETACLSN